MKTLAPKAVQRIDVIASVGQLFADRTEKHERSASPDINTNHKKSTHESGRHALASNFHEYLMFGGAFLVAPLS